MTLGRPRIQDCNHTLATFWHPRFDADPGHRWFRDTVASIASSLTEPNLRIVSATR